MREFLKHQFKSAPDATPHGRSLMIGRGSTCRIDFVRANSKLVSGCAPTEFFPSILVHLFFLKLFGCMLCEAKANGHEVPIDIAPFSQSIMSSRAHLEVQLQFGKCDGTVGRSNLHCWATQDGSVLAGWLYEIDTIAVSVLFAQAERWEHRTDLWHPKSQTSSKRFQIADFMYARRAAKNGDPKEGAAHP